MAEGKKKTSAARYEEETLHQSRFASLSCRETRYTEMDRVRRRRVNSLQKEKKKRERKRLWSDLMSNEMNNLTSELEFVILRAAVM